jgi:hypothetical protein
VRLAGDRSEDFRILVGTVNAAFEDVAAAGANGAAYPSVRHLGGHCIGAFRPRAVGIPHQERHLQDRWNGERVDRSFDGVHDQWIGL